MPEKIKILNVEIDNLTLSELLHQLDSGVLITPNVDHLIQTQHDEEFYQCTSLATYSVCDSKILLFASRFLGTPIKEDICGADFFKAFYTYHSKNEKIKIFLLGAKPGVGEAAMRNINGKIGRDIIIGTYSPPFGFEKDEVECTKVLQVVRQSGANVVVVGLGNPKQTKWIFKYRNQLPDIDIFMALGATIDFEAGNVKRVPAILRKFGLEWFFRMCMEPKRLIKRYLLDDPPFFWYLLKQRLGWYKNPF
jgi:exopolysaccharide biosynthesis WecB/TagA/CpsF family protein